MDIIARESMIANLLISPFKSATRTIIHILCIHTALLKIWVEIFLRGRSSRPILPIYAARSSLESVGFPQPAIGKIRHCMEMRILTRSECQCTGLRCKYINPGSNRHKNCQQKHQEQGALRMSLNVSFPNMPKLRSLSFGFQS